MARNDSVNEPFDFFTPSVDPTGWVRTLQITARRMSAGEHGRDTWPRVRWAGEDCLVIKVQAWDGDRGRVGQGEPLITWTFAPVITATGVHGIALPLGLVQHILDCSHTQFKWSTGGRPGKREAEIRSVVDPIVRSRKARRLDTTEAHVAQRIRTKRGLELNERTLRRWINDVLKMTWDDYVKSVDP